MEELLTVTVPPVRTLSEVMEALQLAAKEHSLLLHIDYERILREFACLWMIARARIRLSRFPQGELTIKTWLRKPSAAVSIRDYALFDGDEEIGSAVYSWTLVHAGERKIVSMKTVAPVWNAPTLVPERQEVLRHLALPEHLPEVAVWQIGKEELDENGHVNNVQYVRRAEALCQGCHNLEVIYNRECFAGERLFLQCADGFVRGVREDGAESFRARFWRNV